MVERSSALPEPSAEGSFAKTPFPHMLLYAYERVLSGTIELAAPNAETATIVFVEGQPAKARTSEPVAYLGRVLLELGMFNEAQLAVSLQAATQEKRLHGQVLLAQGLINQEQLDRGLRAQLMRKLRYLARLPPQTEFRYYDGVDVLRAYGGDARVLVDPFPVVWAAIREAPSWEHVKMALDRVGNSGLKLAPDAALDRFEFEKGERSMAELLRSRPRSAADVAAAGVVDPKLAQQLVYLLLIARQIELVHESLVPPTSSTESVDTPVRLPSDPVAQQRFIDAQFAKAEGATPPGQASQPVPPPLATASSAPKPRTGVYSEVHTRPTTPSMRAVRQPAAPPPPPPPNPDLPPVLGGALMPDPAASPLEDALAAATVGSAFPRPPSALPPPRAAHSTMPAGPVSASEVLRTPLAHAEKASEVVLDRRRQFEIGDAPPPVDVASQGAEHYESAQVYLKINDLEKAEAFCKKAVVCEPENPDYVALQGWIMGLKAEHRGPLLTEVAIEKLDKAVRLDPTHARAYFWRATLRKRLGRDDEAIEDYRQALTLNPENVDAGREIRLIEMRKQNKDKQDEKGGLFGKLFRK